MTMIKFETDELIEANQKLPPNPTDEKLYIGFVLDGSSSMATYTDITIKGYNFFIQTTAKELFGNTIFTSLCFMQMQDSDKDEVYLSLESPIDEAMPINTVIYRPSGGTPLVDKAIKVIALVSNWAKNNPNHQPPVIVLQTDGEDNTSKHSAKDLKDIIAMKRKLGWRFILLGAGVNAESMGSKFGIDPDSSLSYNPQSSYQAFRLLTDAVVRTAKRLGAPVFSIEDKRSVK